MRPFNYLRVEDPAGASAALQASSAAARAGPPTLAPAQFLAGGTTILDLMKLDVMRPVTLVDLNDLEGEHSRIIVDASGLQLGAFARMAAVSEHPAVLADYPVIAQSLRFAASPQIRNMATLGGNVLQRTRCVYFRDTSYRECNKREPGSGCAAIPGVNRKLAVLGVSDQCIATYPGDFAQALVALGAQVRIANGRTTRTIPFETLHRAPGATPDIETTLAPADIIIGFTVPAGPWTKRSLYLKIRDRAAYEFALASAAVALDLDGNTVHEARIALGGVATRPWRAHAAEESLRGRALDENSATRASQIAFADSVTHGGNDDKPELGRRTLIRALLECATL